MIPRVEQGVPYIAWIKGKRGDGCLFFQVFSSLCRKALLAPTFSRARVTWVYSRALTQIPENMFLPGHGVERRGKRGKKGKTRRKNWLVQLEPSQPVRPCARKGKGEREIRVGCLARTMQSHVGPGVTATAGVVSHLSIYSCQCSSHQEWVDAMRMRTR